MISLFYIVIDAELLLIVYFAKEQVLLFGFSVVIVVDDDVLFFLLWSKQGSHAYTILMSSGVPPR